MTAEGLRADRRTVLETLGSGAVLALAGCVGGDGNGAADGEDDTEGDATGGDETDGGDTDEETRPLSEPTEFPEDGECAVCKMIAAEHPDWNAQLAHEDESRAYFCSSGCMAAYYVDPERFDAPDSPIGPVWVTGYETGELIDPSEAYFVRVSNADHVDDVMKMNPTPFGDRADAVTFTEEFEAYSEEDIITLDQFDMELATQYRAQFFEDESGN